MKSVLLIGLGRFGRHMAQKLRDLGHEVLAVDKDEVRQTYRINILATRHGGHLELLPGGSHQFQPDETIYILGENKDVQKFLKN